MQLDVQGIWDELDVADAQLENERRKLQSIWVKVAQASDENQAELKRVEEEERFELVPAHERIKLNVGGQIFEVAAEVLCRERYSILAGVCRTVPIFEPDEDGCFFFDRDWWIFRHILAFLHDGVLPSDGPVLQEMHTEASYYRLNSLRRAIENMPRNHRHPGAQMPARHTLTEPRRESGHADVFRNSRHDDLAASYS